MKLSFLLIACMFSGIVAAQSARLRKADDDYRSLSYALAAEQYEALLGSSSDSPEMRSKLANAYYQMGKMQDAERVYALFVPTGSAAHKDVYQYAQSLKENRKYAESDAWMKKYAALNPTDSRAKEFIQKENYLDVIAAQGTHFTIDSLNINTDEADFGGYPKPGTSELFFVSARKEPVLIRRRWTWNNETFLDVYKTQIEGSRYSYPRLVSSDVNTPYHEGPLCFSPDGKTVYFTRNNISKGAKRKDERGVQQLKMYIAAVEADGSWTNEREFTYNSREYSIGHPALSEDGKTLYFASSMPGGFGGADIYKVTVNGDGTFGQPVNLGPQINTEGQEIFPWIGKEGELFFSSDGHTGLGGLDIFVALSDREGVYRKVMNAGQPMNSSNDDFAFTQNADGKTGYFSSNRQGGKGDDDIYSYVMTKPFKAGLVVKGIATEKTTGLVLANAEIQLVGQDGSVARTMSDAAGNYSFSVEPENTYQVRASKKDYFDNSADLSTRDLPLNTEEIRKDIELEKDPGIALHALVTDGDSKQPLEGVKLKIIDNLTNTVLVETVTSSSGDIMKGLAGKKLNDRLSYTITAEKQGYMNKMVVFNTQIVQPGVINVEQSLDLSMKKMEVGGDLAKLIDIRPIYFDLGKYVIRPDAAKELDKIVKVMNEYPTMEIELGSHTDCRGSIASNEKLSDNRAKASAAYVKARIQNPDRIDGKGYGESKLKNDCGCEGAVKSTCSEAEHQENRRTEFIITRM